jgi:hypothetical protein
VEAQHKQAQAAQQVMVITVEAHLILQILTLLLVAAVLVLLVAHQSQMPQPLQTVEMELQAQ